MENPTTIEWYAALRKSSPYGQMHERLTGKCATRFWRAGATACTGGIDEIEPIQSFYPYSQEPVYGLLG